MPRVDVSDWTPDAVLEQLERLEAQGAAPVVTTVISWKSAAERARDAQQAADERHCRNLRGEKGANKVKAIR